MGELEKYQISVARRKFEEAIPGAVDTIVELAEEAKAEPVRLQAAKTIIDQHDAYVKADADAEALDAAMNLNDDIVQLIKEIQRASVFTDMRAILGVDATPDDLIRLREQLDYVFRITDSMPLEIMAAEIVEDQEE